MTPEEIAPIALAAMYSAVDEEGQQAVIVRAIKDAIAKARADMREECARVLEGYYGLSYDERRIAAAAIRKIDA